MTHGIKNGTMRARTDPARGIVDDKMLAGVQLTLIDDAHFGAISGTTAHMFIATEQLPSFFAGVLAEANLDGRTDEIIALLSDAVSKAAHEVERLKMLEAEEAQMHEWYAQTRANIGPWHMLDDSGHQLVREQFKRERDYWTKKIGDTK